MKQLIAIIIISTIIFSCSKKAEIKPVEPAYAPPNSSYGLIYTKVFAASCALSGCHADGEKTVAHSHGIHLAGADVYDELIDVIPVNSQAAAAGLKLIAPKDPDKSWLYQKMIYSESKHKYGAPMPGGGLTLTDNQILFIKKWIEAGAPKDGHVVDQNLIK